MSKFETTARFVFLVCAIWLNACGGNRAGNEAQVDRPEPPAPYAEKTNPFKGDAQAASAGKEIFDHNCASCHGENGSGEGPLSASLLPRPISLAKAQPDLTDAYLYWRISEGGAFAPFRSSMPAWRTLMDEPSIWQLVSYIRSLRP